MGRQRVRTVRSPPTAGAVVIGASCRALAVIRSLGRRHVPLRVVRCDEHVIAAASRYAGPRLAWPGAGDDRSRIDHLCSLADRERLHGWVLIPAHDEAAALIARHHAELAERFRLTTPPWETLETAYDKRATHAVAAELGLRQPWTVVPTTDADLDEAERHLPVVVKRAHKASASRLTVRADDRATLLRGYLQASRRVDPAILMIEELIPGDGDARMSCAALCEDGEVLASVTARPTHQHPSELGRASTFGETTEDPAIERDTSRLLAAMRFTGLVEVEFKRDARTGENLLLDVSPWPWSCQSLGDRAGVDFPYLLWRMARGARVPGVRAVAGVRGPLEFAVFARDDPMPAFAAPVAMARRLAYRLSAAA
jgi:D-aspartate ligase